MKDIRTFFHAELRKFGNLTMSLVLGLSGSINAARAEEQQPQLVIPTKLSAPKPGKPAEYIPNELLVMASPSADSDDIKESMEAVHGTVLRTIGYGPMTVYVVQTEQGKLEETEKKLKADEHFSTVQRNGILQEQQSAGYTPNDPFYPSEWHLAGLSVTRAWNTHRAFGRNVTVAVLDTGCKSNSVELQCSSGYDGFTQRLGQAPTGDHGSMVATTIGARTNNRTSTAAIAPEVNIFPCKICNSKGQITEDAMIASIYMTGVSGFRIINLSANATPPNSLSNQKAHPIFHSYAQWFFNSKNGLLFLAAGNESKEDKSALVSYLVPVSAIGRNYSLASFSNYGNNLWFTAPGESIYCTDAKNRTVSVSGTSFSAPGAAGVAALILGAKPQLNNKQVLSIMANTCYKPNTGQTYTKYYGYGLLNAELAVRRARGL